MNDLAIDVRPKVDRSRAIVRYFGQSPIDGDRLRLPSVPFTKDLAGMGPLVWMEVRLFDGRREKWSFSPFPRLMYHRRTKHLWAMGGSYRFDGDGFHHGKGPSPLNLVAIDDARRAEVLAGQRRLFRDTHNGREPDECVQGLIVRPDPVIALATVTAIAYRNDRNDGDGRVNWRHPFEPEYPIVVCDISGSHLAFCGGTYSVEQGWLVD